MYVNNLCITETWSYVDTDLCTVTKQLNKLLLYFIIFSIIFYETEIVKAMKLKRENTYVFVLV
jgi:hypothetical protein